MAYVFGQGTSYGRLRRYTSQVIGGLEARQELATLAPEWRAMQARIVEGRAERERADDQVLFVDAKARVEDADFDRATTGLSGKSWSLSGKNKANEPHATLFGKLTAADIKRLGVVKASTEGRRLVKQSKALGNPDLEPELGAFETATEALIAVTAAIEAADDGLFAPRQAKNKLVRELNRLVAVTEANILMAFPGRRDLVSAILAPWFERRTKRTAGGGEDTEPSDGPTEPILEDEERDEDSI